MWEWIGLPSGNCLSPVQFQTIQKQSRCVFSCSCEQILWIAFKRFIEMRNDRKGFCNISANLLTWLMVHCKVKIKMKNENIYWVFKLAVTWGNILNRPHRFLLFNSPYRLCHIWYTIRLIYVGHCNEYISYVQSHEIPLSSFLRHLVYFVIYRSACCTQVRHWY